MKHKLQNLLKHKLQWLLLLAALLGVSQGVLGYNEFNKDFLYIDCTDFTSYSVVNVDRYWDYNCTNKQDGTGNLPTLSNATYVHYNDLRSITDYGNLRGFEVSQGSGWWDKGKMGVVDGSSDNCIKVNNWGSYSWTTYVQKPSYTGLTVTNAISGTGTSADPYIVYTNTSFTLSSSASLPQSDDSKMSIRYYHGDSSSGDATETSSTKDITSSSTAGVKTQYYGRVRGYYSEGSNNYSSYADDRSVYVQTVSPATFEEGQVVWLDIRTSGSEAGWGQESGETFYVRIDDSDSYRRAMTKVAGNGTNSRSSVWIYKITKADEELSKSSLKFQRAKDNDYWNKSIELTASDVKSGNNGVYITKDSWDGAGTKYNANSLTSVSNPSLTMKNSAGSSTITECQAGDEVNFSSTVPTISVNNTSKGSLTTPLYIYTFTEGSYSSGQQTSNPYSWTTAVANSGSGTASVKVSFAIDGSNTSSRTIDSGYEKTGSTSFTVNSACVDPNIETNLDPSTSWSKCGNADGRQLSITASGGSGTLTYQWFRNTTNTLTDGVADLTGATAVTDMVEGGNTYSPSASDYGKFYYCCVVRSGGACSANKATSVYTGEIEIKQTPTVKPSTITVKQYEPVRLQATNSSVNWSITAYPGDAAADEYYLYDETKNSAMFKGKAGSYTVTATSTGSDCTSTSAITVENDPNTCN